MNAPRSIANIESAEDPFMLIPTRDGTGFATICSGGAVHIYNTDNPMPMFGAGAKKPVIYLYPKKTTEITLSVELREADMVAVYPKMHDGEWKVQATPLGNLRDTISKKKYSYLFWEAEKRQSFTLDNRNAHCIKSADIEEYLETSLATLGLNAKEANDFIVYWLPVMEQNPYSVIEWKTAEYTDMAKLHISPKPDTVIRVFMVFQGSSVPVETGNPKLAKARRKGYSVVEWGGCNKDEGKWMK